MQLSSEHLAAINKYTDAYRIDREKLISYLEKHKTIKLEVFSYCSRVSKRSFDSRGFCSFLKDDTFSPISRETFIRRIPFYFYQAQFLGDKRTGLSKIFPVSKKGMSKDDFEGFFSDLEWVFYDLKISLDIIYNYICDQFSNPPRSNQNEKLSVVLASSAFGNGGLTGRDAFPMWVHYLKLCQELGWTDYTPKRFISAYNYALEASGLEPILYRPLRDYVTYYTRVDDIYVFRGNFPCDPNGVPIMQWTTIRVQNPTTIEFIGQKSCYGELRIGLGPKTVIHVREWYSDAEDDEVFFQYEEEEDDGATTSADVEDEPLMWRQIYAGPLTMEFNNLALKEARLEHKFTQADVATAIGTSVRTYQKWECGETIPDGSNLLRLMNWLNIADPQSLIIYNDYPD